MIRDALVSTGNPMVVGLISSCEISFPLDANLAVSGKKSLKCVKSFFKILNF